MRFLSALQLSILVACKAPSDTDPTDSDGPDTDVVETDSPPLVDTGTTPGNTGLTACSGLAVDPVAPVVEAGGIVLLAGSGGTGDYVWSVAAGGSGTVTPSGIYAAPEAVGVETVVLGDAGCDGTVSTDITVVPGFVVEPSSAHVPPGSSVSIGVSGGSGAYTCSLASSTSGASLTSCSYVAGSAEGVDVVRVVDPVTGSVAQVVLTVDLDASLSRIGQQGWMLPVGSRFDPVIEGGSGRYTFTVANPNRATAGFDADLGVSFLEGLSAGNTTVTVQDTHVGALSFTAGLRILQPHIPPVHHSGAFLFDAEAISRDLDGDGFPELIIGAREASVLAHQGGHVAVFAGTATGPDVSAPLWERSGAEDRGNLGKAVAFGDLNDDGIEDLVLGAPGVPWVFNTAGEVTVHLGDGTGSFEDAAFARFTGPASGDRLGEGVGACDVDGDGLEDLVMAAMSSEPTTGTSRAGMIEVRRQLPNGGFSANPIRRYAQRQVGSAWEFVNNGRLGEYGFGVGDFDHDGLCDVVAAVDARDWASDASGPGFLLVFAGDAAIGLSESPVRVIEPGGGDTGVRFGRYLAVGQIDGVSGPSGEDDDLLFGARGYDGVGGTTSSTGAAYVFAGTPTPAPLIEGPSDADWSLVGVGGNDLVGDGVGIASDGDVLVAVRGESRALRIPGGAGFGTGDFDLDTLPSGALSIEPSEGADEDIALFGLALADWGDGVFGYSRYDQVLSDGTVIAVDTLGLHGVLADGTTTTWLLGSPSGQQFGRNAVLLDTNGDGTRDVVVGGPEAADPLWGGLSGTVQSWTGAGWQAIGADTGPTMSSSDRRGWWVSSGDVDGTSGDDLLVFALADSRPDSPDLDFTCPGGLARSSAGHLAVHLSGGGGVDDAAAFYWWPPVNSARPESVASGFDADGDGFEDVLIGLSNDTAALVYGEAAPPSGQRRELCRQEIWSVSESSTEFGAAVAAIGDLDGDGCDEGAIGAWREDLGVTDQGTVRVVWGASPSPGQCARTQPEFTTHTAGLVNQRLGLSLGGGSIDVTGDGVPDLAVGGINRTFGGFQVGDGLLISGSHLAGFAGQSQPAVGGVVPEVQVPLHPTSGAQGVESWQGTSEFGQSVALLRGSGGQGYLAVGMPTVHQASQLRTGGVAVYRVTAGLLEAEPAWFVAGESFRDDSDFGFSLTSSGSDLAIGAPGSSALGSLHVGGAYVAPL